MSNINSEEIILNSNDNSITLTTHRIMQREKGFYKEIFLSDVVSHMEIKKRITYYKVLSVILAIPVLLLLGNQSSDTEPFLIFFCILLAISVILLLTRFENFLKISGRYNEIIFSIEKIDQSSLNKFITRLIVESENRKRD